MTRDGKLVATMERGQRFRIENSETREAIGPEEKSGQPIHGMEFSTDPDQHWLLTWGGTIWGQPGLAEVWEWKTADGKVMERPVRVATLPHKSLVNYAHFRPGGGWVLTHPPLFCLVRL